MNNGQSRPGRRLLIPEGGFAPAEPASAAGTAGRPQGLSDWESGAAHPSLSGAGIVPHGQ